MAEAEENSILSCLNDQSGMSHTPSGIGLFIERSLDDDRRDGLSSNVDRERSSWYGM
jgi:hypothetical protein